MRPFQQVDVFSPQPLQGNPVAVVLDGTGLTTEQLLRFTRWSNLSEATYVVPPSDPAADYAVRIFTASGELPFAGHPTLGTCHAWLRAGGVPRDAGRIVQQCPAGLIAIRRLEGLLAFEAPPLTRWGPVAAEDVERSAAVLGVGAEDIVDSQWVDNGPGWVAVMLPSAEAVLALRPAGSGKDVSIGVVGMYPPGAECAYEVRAIFSNHRGDIVEDPVTGSLNASLGQWLTGSGRVQAPYTVSQGTMLGRMGRPRISQDQAGSIWVAGSTHTVVEGWASFDEDA
jgi:PhzF family phenazine biosynthesis protein